MQTLLVSSSHPSTVKAAHNLAAVLKKSRPNLRDQIEELQGIVTRTHKKLHELERQAEKVACVCEYEGSEYVADPLLNNEAGKTMLELEAAYQALRELKRPGAREMKFEPMLVPTAGLAAASGMQKLHSPA